MKKILCAIMLAAVFLAATAALAVSEAATVVDRVGLIIYLLGADEKPLGNTTLLLQENLDAQEAYEGETDNQGIMMIPSFPLTGFVMAARDSEDRLAGIVEVTLYPGTETRIMNNPKSDNDVLTLERLRSTQLSEHINGAAPLELADGADTITMYHYEVQVSTSAGGLGALFKTGSGDLMTLEGVSDGAPGAVIPEPTLPPDIEDNPPASQTSAPASPTETQGPSQTPAPATDAPEEPTDTKPSADPTGTAGQITAAPSPTEQPSPSGETPSPTEQPSPSGETPTPTPPPSPSPTSAPTTAADLVNVKLLLKDAAGKPCAYYRTRLDGSVEAMANGEGEAYYTNITADVTHELIVYNQEGTEVGSCGLRFVEGESTSIASVNTGGTYTINFQAGTQDVYVELTVETQNLAPAEVSNAPLATPTPGAPAGSGAAPTAAAPAAQQDAQASEDVIGTPVLTPASAGPTLNGYFSDEEGIAIGGATIRLRNEDTKALSSAITTAEGTFTISQLPPGNYSLGALSPQGRSLGEVPFTVARGSKTRLKTSSNGTTYLSEGQNTGEVYLDLREMPNGTLSMLYASDSPMAAPVMAANAPASAAAGQLAVPDAVAIGNMDDTTIVEEPAPQGLPAGMIWLICGLCGAGVIAAVVAVRRHTGIK